MSGTLAERVRDHLLHLARPADLERAGADGRYRCPSLESEGFVHCCTAAQLDGVLARYYAEDDDLVLLVIDPEALDVELRHENTVGGEERFPHVYGPIPLAAVRATHPFGRDAAARREWPDTTS